MLNEFYELRQYICSFPSDVKRLKYGTLASDLGKIEGSKSINALTRPLTTIARAILFSKTLENVDRDLKIQMAECAMKAWMGIEYDASPVEFDAEGVPFVRKKNNDSASSDPQNAPPSTCRSEPMISVVERVLRDEYGTGGKLLSWLRTYCVKVVFREKTDALLAKFSNAELDTASDSEKNVITELKNKLRTINKRMDSAKGLSDREITQFREAFETYVRDKGSVLNHIELQNISASSSAKNNKITMSNDFSPIIKAAMLPEMIKKKGKSYEFHMFKMGLNADETSQNTLNQITFEKIIADALEEGALRKQHLACVPGWQNGLFNHTMTKALTKEDEDFLLKSIVLYLRSRRCRTGCDQFVDLESAKIEQVDLANWCLCTSKTNDVSECLKKRLCRADRLPLFQIGTNEQLEKTILLAEGIKDELLQYFTYSETDQGIGENKISISKSEGYFYLKDTKQWKTRIHMALATEETRNKDKQDQPWQLLKKAICLCLKYTDQPVALNHRAPKMGKTTVGKPILAGFYPEQWYYIEKEKPLYIIDRPSRQKNCNYTKLSVDPAIRNRFCLVNDDDLDVYDESTGRWKLKTTEGKNNDTQWELYNEDPTCALFRLMKP